MTRCIDDLLPEYAAGTLEGGAAAEVEAHLPGCRRCATELTVIDEVYAHLALALPAPPAPGRLRERVLADIAPGGPASRFEAFVARVAALLDLAKDRARQLVDLIDNAASWQPGPAGTSLIHLPAGPRVAPANCGFVRLPAAAHFPTHRHLGEEHVLVIQGGFVDSSGRVLHAGDEDVKTTGTEHAFTVLGGVDLIYLVILEKGIEIAGASGGTF